MKTLYIEVLDKATLLYFTGTNKAIAKWVQENLNNHVFNLSESFSCSVELWGNEILINGDEDRMTLTIRTIKPIKL